MESYQRPHPLVDELSLPFWEGYRRHELLVQKCAGCGKYVFPPKAACPICGSWDLKLQKVSGKGKVFSYIIFYTRDIYPSSIEPTIPYAVVKVVLDEQDDLFMLSNIIDCPVDQIKVGMPLKVVFEDVDDKLTLPKFQRVK